MKKAFLTLTVSLFLTALLSSTALGHAHTHIGINQPDDPDSNQLWIFGTLSQPQWPTLDLLPTGQYLPGGQQVYKAELNCWVTTGHPDYRLDNTLDQGDPPSWELNLRRLNYSDPVNFWLADDETGLDILESDNESIVLPVDWSEAQQRYRIHYHASFYATGNPGDTFDATFTVFETNGLYDQVDPYTFTFQIVPEPATIILLGLGFIAVKKSRA